MYLILGVLLVSLAYMVETISYKYFKENKITVILGVCFFTFAFFGITFFVYSLINSELLLANINFFSLYSTFINAILYMIGILLWILAVKNIYVSIAAPLSNFQIVLTTFFSWLLFADVLSVYEIIILIVLLVACVLLGFETNKQSAKKNKIESKKFLIGLMFLTLWIVATVTRNILTKTVILNSLHPVTFQTFKFFFASLVSAVLFLIFNRKKKGEMANQLRTVIKNKWYYFIGIANTVSGIIFLLLIQNHNIGLIQAMANLSSVLIIIYSRLVFKEKISILSYFYIGAIIVSAVLLSFI